jgi:tRNA A-37 threonylcarbamoyl transferase component Bud32
MSNFTIHSNNNNKLKIKLTNEGYSSCIQNNHRSTMHSYHYNNNDSYNKLKNISLDKSNVHSNSNSNLTINNNKHNAYYYFPKLKIKSFTKCNDNNNIHPFHIPRLNFCTIKNKETTLNDQKSNRNTPERINNEVIKNNNNNKQYCLLSQEKVYHHSSNSNRIMNNFHKKIHLKKINIFPIHIKDNPLQIPPISIRINERIKSKEHKTNIMKRSKPRIKINLSVPDHLNNNYNTIYHKPLHQVNPRKCENIHQNRMQPSLSSVTFIKKNTLSIDSINKYQESTVCSQSAMSKYIIGKEIGKGAYATVRLCLYKKNKYTYAAKIYTNFLNNKSITKRAAVTREIEILKQLNHPNVIKLHQHFFENSSLYLIMELAKGMRLSLYLKAIQHHKLDEIKTRKIFYQLLSALNYLHSMNICHRDIKLDNIIINQHLDIKLIDFGFATKLKDPLEKLKLFCGTPNYMAPEIVKKIGYIGPPTDMWSAGVILYYLLTGSFPFKGKSQSELSKSILSGIFHLPKTVSLNAQHLISTLLCINPEKRIPASKALKHIWFNNK